MPSAPPMRPHVMQRSRSRPTHSRRPPSTWACTAAIRGHNSEWRQAFPTVIDGVLAAADAPELYGPAVESLLGRNLFGPALDGRTARWIGRLDQPFAPMFVDDFAALAAAVAGTDAPAAIANEINGVTKTGEREGQLLGLSAKQELRRRSQRRRRADHTQREGHASHHASASASAGTTAASNTSTRHSIAAGSDSPGRTPRSWWRRRSGVTMGPTVESEGLPLYLPSVS